MTAVKKYQESILKENKEREWNKREKKREKETEKERERKSKRENIKRKNCEKKRKITAVNTY
jgi:hypothetical protein